CPQPAKIDDYDRLQVTAALIRRQHDPPPQLGRQRRSRLTPAKRARTADDDDSNLVGGFGVRDRAAIAPHVYAALRLHALVSIAVERNSHRRRGQHRLGGKYPQQTLQRPGPGVHGHRSSTTKKSGRSSSAIVATCLSSPRLTIAPLTGSSRFA